MNTKKQIPFGKPWITDKEKQAVLDVLSGTILTHGPQSKAFESEFADFMGGDAYCVSVSSCMAALHLAYLQMGIESGDEVIVPAQTHVATAHAVELVGARPIFVDCEAETGNIDSGQIEKFINKNTKAISLVHFLGIPCDMETIMEIANQHKLKVVEDCALAVGARYEGVHVGLFGDAGCFSFYPVKHITTGDGGMFVSRHESVAQQVSKWRAFGVDKSFAERTIPGMYDTPNLGMNYRMSDINASIGRQQLNRIEEIITRRKHNFETLKEGVANLENVTVLDSQDDRAQSSFYCLTIVLNGILAEKRNDIVKELNYRGIGTSVYYPQPVPRMTYYRNKYGHDDSQFPNAVHISDHSISLPVGPHLGGEETAYIVEHVTQTINGMS